MTRPKLAKPGRELDWRGKDDNLRRADFRALATSSGLKAADADTAIDDTLRQIALGIDRFSLPKTIECSTRMEKMIEGMIDTCPSRAEAFE
jgi:serine/threonine-protein kinase HipA